MNQFGFSGKISCVIYTGPACEGGGPVDTTRTHVDLQVSNTTRTHVDLQVSDTTSWTHVATVL